MGVGEMFIVKNESMKERKQKEKEIMEKKNESESEKLEKRERTKQG